MVSKLGLSAFPFIQNLECLVWEHGRMPSIPYVPVLLPESFVYTFPVCCTEQKFEHMNLLRGNIPRSRSIAHTPRGLASSCIRLGPSPLFRNEGWNSSIQDSTAEAGDWTSSAPPPPVCWESSDSGSRSTEYHCRSYGRFPFYWTVKIHLRFTNRCMRHV